MSTDPYRLLAAHLDSLPNGFPPTEDGCELRILQKLFTPQEAALAAQLKSEPETAEEIAARTGRDVAGLQDQLKSLARRGLINVERRDRALAFQSSPFVVGFYESQLNSMDAELARLVEAYFKSGFQQMLGVEPPMHRVIPVNQTVDPSTEVRPYESAVEIVSAMQSWAVQDCVCRKQKAMIGQVCKHPIDVCLAMAPVPHAFDHEPNFRALSRDEAIATLRRAAEAGLVHTITNSMEGAFYVCNCCTCSCGLLRGLVEFGIANVVASSPFVNQVDPLLCNGCEACIPACQFDALTMSDGLAEVEHDRCAGCGVCVLTCATGALLLVRRPAEEIKPIPRTPEDWRRQRLAARGLAA